MPVARRALQILPKALLHRCASFPFFLPTKTCRQHIHSESRYLGWQREAFPLVLLRGDLRMAAASCCWAKCRSKARATVVPF